MVVRETTRNPAASDISLDRSFRPDSSTVTDSLSANRFDSALSQTDIGPNLRMLTAEEVASLANSLLGASRRGELEVVNNIKQIGELPEGAARAALPGLRMLIDNTDLVNAKRAGLELFARLAPPEFAQQVIELALAATRSDYSALRRAGYEVFADHPDGDVAQSLLDGRRREKNPAVIGPCDRAIEACLRARSN